MHRLWAAFERVLPRGLAALTGVVVAAVTNPEAVGIYSWGVLALTLIQAISDQPIRQVAIQSVGADGRRFLTQYAVASTALGAILMLATCYLVAVLATSGSSVLRTFLELIPLALVPAALALAVTPTAKLQRNSRWARVSLYRLVASIVGVSIGVPIAVSTGSILGATLALLVTEATFCILCSIGARGEEIRRPQEQAERELSHWRVFTHLAVYSALGWLQGQSDRALIGGFAGTAALGSYSLGSSVGRSAGDAIAASQATVLRVRITTMSDPSDRDLRQRFSENMRSSLILSVASAFVVIALTEFVVAPILGPAWSSALGMVPVLSLCAIPACVSWSSGVVHIQRGKTRQAIVAPMVGILFAPLVAIVAISSLTAAAWLVLAREVALASVQLILMGRAAPWREAAIGSATLVLCAVLVLVVATI